ncbi:hypothetical protein [Paraburkholderia youngii]|uniref:hypothetical protein n=1 Tax=Paraburkholderia youngii TaxID=2782701 RepID=UPI003D22678E
MKLQQSAIPNASSAVAISLLGVYSPALGTENAGEFAAAKEQFIRNLRETMSAVETLSLEDFRNLALRGEQQVPADPVPPMISDFLDSTGRGSLYAKDGRKILGTVEIQEATGRLRGAHRDALGRIRYEDVDVDSDGCDYDTMVDGSGRVFFEAEKGPHVNETDVVIVSKSRVEEFLAAVTTPLAKASTARKAKRA